jgi:hypothetical protein
MPQRHLYHVTLTANLPSIQLGGLDPTRSKGKRPLVWLVTASRIHWAIAHCCMRHNCSVGALTVCQVTTDQSKLVRTRLRGVWASPHNHPVAGHDSAILVLKADLNEPKVEEL